MSGTRPKRTPMQVFLRRTLGCIAIGAIVWALYSIPYDILRQERARAFGENRTTGLVLTVEKNDANQNSDNRYFITYKYIDPDAYAHVAAAPLPYDIWKKFAPGDRVIVFYAKNKPTLARISGQIHPPFQNWLIHILH